MKKIDKEEIILTLRQIADELEKDKISIESFTKKGLYNLMQADGKIKLYYKNKEKTE